MTLYPVFLKLEGRRCLVVGGGKVALRKVRDLVAAGARVVVVAPEFVDELEEMAGDVELVRREFEPDDLDGATIAVAATDSASTNERVYREARKRGVLTNVVDTPDLCDFFLPARARWDNLEIAVSTLGRSPLAARLIRDLVKDAIRDEHLKLIEFLADVRKRLQSSFAEPAERERFWERFASLPLVRWAEEGKWERMKREAEACGLRWSE